MKSILRLLLLLLALPGYSQDGRPPTSSLRAIKIGAVNVLPLVTAPAATKRSGTVARPTAAPDASNTTTYVNVNAGLVAIPSFQYTVTSPNTITTATVTVPTANGTKGTLYAFNSGYTNGGVITANNNPISYNFVNFPNLAFQPANGFAGPYVFTFALTDNTGAVSNVATYTIMVGAPTAKDQTSQILLSSFAATTLSLPLVGTPDPAANNTVTDFLIRSLPSAAAGVLSLGGTPVTVNQVVSLANAGNLAFDPAPGFFGTAVFTYAARDNAGGVSVPAGYGIPVSNQACGTGVGQVSVVDFSARTIGENFTTANKTFTADGVTVTVNPTAFPYTNAAASQSSVDIQDLIGLPGKGLVWQENYSNGSAKSSSVTFTFSRPVANFTMTLGDIDRNTSATADVEYIDRMTFSGYDASGTLIVLPAANVSTGIANTYTGNNVVTATANTPGDPADNVTVSFPQAITRLTLTYQNVTANADAGFQFVSIPQFSWCSQADVYAQFSSGTTATTTNNNVNYTVAFGNNGTDPANPLARTVTLPVGVTNVVVPGGATYTAATRVIDFGSISVASGGAATFAFSFNAPATASTYSLIANASSPAEDNVPANNTATLALVVSDCATTSTLDYTAATTQNGTATTGIRRGAINGGAASQGPTTDTATDGITVNYLSYTAPVAPDANTQDDFYVGTSGATTGQTLVWRTTSTVVGAVETVTMLLSRPVDNLSLKIQDIDKNLNPSNFTDQVTFDGYPTASGGTAATLTAANFVTGTANSFVGNNTIQGTANSNTGQTLGDLTLNFTSPVQRLVFTYTNLSTVLGNRTNTIGIVSLTYCSPADVATTVTAAASPVSGGGQGQFNVTFTNNGPNAAANVTRQVQLATGLVGVVATNGGTYDSATGLVSYTSTATLASGANLNSTITFTTPNTGTTTATATINTTTTEGGLTANNTASGSIVSTPVANVATVITGPVSVNAAQTATLNVSFSNVGALDASAVMRTVSLPAGVTGVVATGGTITGNVVAGYTVTYPTLATLAAGASNAFTITYTAPASGTVTTTSNTSTTSSEGGLTANNTSSVSTTVGLVADVTTTLAGPTALNAGQPSGTYTVAFTNNGPSTASAVTQRVTLPAGVTNVFVNGSPFTPTASIIDFGTAATLASGATNQFTFSFTAPTTTGGITVASAVTTVTNQGANTATDNASLSPTVNATANVATTVTPGAASVLAGQTGTFNVSFSNSGPQAAAGVVAAVQLPAGLAGVVATNGGTYNSTTGVVSYTGLTSQASGASTSSVITFTMPATGPVTAAATTSTTTNEAGQTANNVASASIDVTPAYDVTTVITGPTTTAVGVQTTFSISTINNGPSVAPTVVQTVTGLPTSLSNVYVSNGGTYNAATGTVTFPALATLANGARADNTISFTPTTATGFTATATVTANTNNANDSNTVNNSVAASATTVNAAPAATSNANLFTTITTPSANVAPGAATTFTVTSGNNGAGTATTVVQLVTLPTGLSGVVVKDGVGTVIPGAYNATTGLVTFPTVTSLSSGSSVLYTIDATAPASGVLAAVATISAATADVMSSNNIATADVTVTPVTDVTVRLTGPNTAASGSPATYTVTTTNNGPVTATGVVTAVSIPAGLSGVTVSGGGTYNATTGAVSFPATASLLNGASVANTITYTMPSLATFANVASVTSTTTDNLLANNSAAVTTVTEPLADVTVTLSGPATIVQGNQVDYVLSSTNNGPAAASNVAIRVQLPVGLPSVISTGGTYNSTTGVLTFPAITNQLAGTDGTITYGIRFIAPSTLTSLNPSAYISTSSEETNYTNNVATIATTATPATAGTTDLQIAVVASTTTPVAGQPLTLNITTTNLNNANTTVAATNVAQRVTLQPGLLITSITNGGTYDAVTGVVTFPALASLTSGSSAFNTILLTTPGMSPLTVRALVTGDQTDAVPGNNVSFQNLIVTQRADVTTALSGPTTAQPGDLVTYSVITLNNGPSVATGVVQTVTLPAGATNVVVSGGGTLSGNTVTFPTIASQVAGANGQVANTISFNNPAAFTTSYDVVANVTTTSVQPTPPGTTNDAATFTTTKGNRAPVANAVTNVLQGPEGNTAGPLLISSLSGTDADGNGTIASYTITTIPDATKQGTLSLNGTAVTANQVIAVADIAKLTFDPLSTFTGNAFFTYTALDNAGAVSAPAVYTIPVGQDLNSFYTTTPNKGGASRYANNDVLAFVIDPNTAVYNSSGLVYNPTGTPATGTVSNGLPTTGTNAVLASGTLPRGVSLDPATGRIFVSNADITSPTGLINYRTAQTYTVSVTTTDVNGGTNTVPVTFTIGAYPLPVELTDFSATAKSQDAQLVWHTASEKNNDHFNVERSLNGTDFVKIGQVKGQGTTSAPTNYALTDAGIGAKATDLVYYRLQQVDVDGTSAYSPVRTVAFTKAVAVAIALYPNPAAAGTTLDLGQLPTGTYQVSLLDATGRTVLATTLSAGAHALDLHTLASGTYMVLVRGQSGSNNINLTKRLIKE